MEDELCQRCGSPTKYYDCVKRLIRRPSKHYIYVERVKCIKCGFIHRILPKDILPFKQYTAEVISRAITGDDGYSIYPCQMTVYRWKHTDAKITSSFMEKLIKENYVL